MEKHNIPYFSAIDLNNLESMYNSTFSFQAKEIRLYLWFEQKSIEAQELVPIHHFFAQVETINRQVNAFIRSNFEEHGSVLDYLEHHLSEIEDANYDKIFKNTDPAKPKIEQLFSTLHLKTISIAPQGQHYFTFDFTIDADFTNYLVVVCLNKDLELEYITMES